MTAGSVRASPGPDPSRPLAPPAPQPRPSQPRPGRGAAPGAAGSHRPRPGQPRRPPSRGPRGACRWAQGAARPEDTSGPGKRAAGAGLAQARRHLPAPHGTAAPQSSPGADELRPKPTESPGSRAEPHSGPFKSGRARGPPGLRPLGRLSGSAQRWLRPSRAAQEGGGKRTCGRSAPWWPQVRTTVFLLRRKECALRN